MRRYGNNKPYAIMLLCDVRTERTAYHMPYKFQRGNGCVRQTNVDVRIWSTQAYTRRRSSGISFIDSDVGQEPTQQCNSAAVATKDGIRHAFKTHKGRGWLKETNADVRTEGRHITCLIPLDKNPSRGWECEKHKVQLLPYNWAKWSIVLSSF